MVNCPSIEQYYGGGFTVARESRARRISMTGSRGDCMGFADLREWIEALDKQGERWHEYGLGDL